MAYQNNSGNLDVYDCGTMVTFVNMPGVRGSITGIRIRDRYVSYEVSYFLNNIYCSVYFAAYELEFQNNSNKIKIGFKILEDQ